MTPERCPQSSAALNGAPPVLSMRGMRRQVHVDALPTSSPCVRSIRSACHREVLEEEAGHARYHLHSKPGEHLRATARSRHRPPGGSYGYARRRTGLT